MKLKVSSKSPYGKKLKSITEDFTSPDLPAFTILTGLNGSGKTHLLEAIKKGFVVVENININDIVLFNYSNFLQNSKVLANTNLKPEELWNKLQESIKNDLPFLESNTGIGQSDWKNYINHDQLYSRWDEKDTKSKEIQWRLQDFVRNVERSLTNNQEYLKSALFKLELSLGKSYLIADKDEFVSAFKDIDIIVDLFSNSLGSVFSYYHTKYVDNLLRKFLSENGSSAKSLSQEKFEELYGHPPWEIVDEFLELAGLPFSITKPTPLSKIDVLENKILNKNKNYTYFPMLSKRGTSDLIGFDSLSSGEMILASLATALFNESPMTHHQTKVPKLVLLDEVDAPLHPQQVHKLLKILTEIFVQKHGISVILATHKPSTVALADDQAIHVMEALPPTISFTGREKSLRLLTSGIPTLSLSFDYRKQVFVESFTDAKRYDKLYELLKVFFSCDNSLSFIEVGNKTKEKPETNAGCDQVKRLVKEFRTKGNGRVLGLIDWDKKNVSIDGIVVVGENESYSIENILLNPLLIFSILIHMGEKNFDGFDSSTRFVDLKNAPLSVLQKGCDAIQNTINFCENHSLQNISYTGGFSLNIKVEYLTMYGKDLEAELKKAFPPLNRFNRAGGLMDHVIKLVLNEIPEFTPSSIMDAFQNLANY